VPTTATAAAPAATEIAGCFGGLARAYTSAS
jgi:hypothetical protein